MIEKTKELLTLKILPKKIKKGLIRKTVIPEIVNIQNTVFENGNLTSINGDTNISIKLSDFSRYLKVIVNISSEKEEKSSQIFYKSLNEDFCEERSVKFFTNQTNVIYLCSDNLISHLRLDSINTDGKFDICYFEIINISKSEYQITTKFKIIESLIKKIKQNPSLLRKLIKTIRNDGFLVAVHKIKKEIKNTTNSLDFSKNEIYKNWIDKFDRLNDLDVDLMKEGISTFKYKPKISILMPVYNTKMEFLKQCIDSILNQVYEDFELCIADDNSSNEEIRKEILEYAKNDSRVKYIFRNENGHISESSNSALNLCTGEYTILVDHDDLIPIFAIYTVVYYVNKYNNEVDILYSDEDKIDENNYRYDPYFKTDWNKYLVYSQNFVAHMGIYRTSLLKHIGGFRKGYEGSQDYDILLRLLPLTSDNRIIHIPFVLYHWRIFGGNSTFSTDNHDISDKSAYKALYDYVNDNNLNINIEKSKYFKGCWNPKFLLHRKPKVSIIIPTKDKVDILSKCIDGLLNRTEYKNFEIIIIDNNSLEEKTYAYYKTLDKSKIKIIMDKSEFNYSRLNNDAVKISDGEILVFMNNDIDVINQYWLDEMVSLSIRDDVGVVGAKLLYQNNTIQHVGVTLGIYGVACHPLRHLESNKVEYFGFTHLLRNVSAVTAACMSVRRQLFDSVCGFDEDLFAVGFNDVDFSLKILKKGYNNLINPNVLMYHYESISRGNDDTIEKIERHRKESRNMILKYGKLLKNDLFYNKNLSLDTENYDLDFIPRLSKPWKNWVEFIVPFHRGDVVIAIQVAFTAYKLGINLRFHVSSKLYDMVMEYNPPFQVHAIDIGIPSAKDTLFYAQEATKLVEKMNDFSGKIVVSHKSVDFKNNGLNIVEYLLNELELPIDTKIDNVILQPQKIECLDSIDKKTVLIHSNAGWELKSLPNFLLDNIVNVIKKNGYKLIQIGSKSDKRILGCDGYLLNNYNLKEWTSVIEKGLFVICVDSWFSHFVSINDKNAIIFYSSTSPKYVSSKQHFVRKQSLYLENGSYENCSPCDSLICRKNSTNICESFKNKEYIEKLNSFIEQIKEQINEKKDNIS